ncbi:DUF2892 domain-containing protein [Pararhodobacter sp. SW119]|uniref:YgaP family membrane protein n=1 Tax=Pararhodobacter sp. SW119 TaxID=2780075 RepID=UPI001AE0B3E5|nr:DUF2892 domain-containing protein [Pararhodobacter sp. SW119]
MLETNMGSIDRILRAAVGVALILAFFLLPDLSWRWVLWIGVIPLVTSVIGWCPAYTLVGISTCPRSGGSR